MKKALEESKLDQRQLSIDDPELKEAIKRSQEESQ